MISLFNCYQKCVLDRKHQYRLRAITFSRLLFVLVPCFFSFASMCFAIGQDPYVDNTYSKGDFCLAQRDDLATIYVDIKDHIGVTRAVMDLQADIVRVTGREPKVMNEKANLEKNSIVSRQHKWHRLRLLVRGGLQVFSCMQENT